MLKNPSNLKVEIWYVWLT